MHKSGYSIQENHMKNFILTILQDSIFETYKSFQTKGIEHNDQDQRSAMMSETIFKESLEVFSELFTYYELLIISIQTPENKEQKLKNINDLFSFIGSPFLNHLLSNTIDDNQYDREQIISMKKKIVESIKANQTSSLNCSMLANVFGFLSAMITVNTFLKNIPQQPTNETIKEHQSAKEAKYVVDKKLFDKIITNLEAQKKETPAKEIKKEGDQGTVIIKGVSNELVESILKKIAIFEKQKDYLSPKIYLYNLARKFKTNSSYLSKIINVYKKTTFTNYINNLRIEYTICKLVYDSKFRNYTMLAIAESVGFNSTKSFSKAFLNKTGIMPTYFIKQVKMLHIDQNK